MNKIIIYGTSYFTDRLSALMYYKDYEPGLRMNRKLDVDELERIIDIKLKEGSIHIGEMPPLKDGETIAYIDRDGRYHIEAHTGA